VIEVLVVSLFAIVALATALTVLIWTGVRRDARRDRSFDELVAQMVALKSTFAAEAFAKAQHLKQAQQVANTAVAMVEERKSNDVDPDEEIYG
jgi:hypothetical protein